MKSDFKIKYNTMLKQYETPQVDELYNSIKLSSPKIKSNKTFEIKRDILLSNPSLAFQNIIPTAQKNEQKDFSRIQISNINSSLNMPNFKKETPNLDKLKSDLKLTNRVEQPKEYNSVSRVISRISSTNNLAQNPTQTKLMNLRMMTFDLKDNLFSSSTREEKKDNIDLKSLDKFKTKLMKNREFDSM